MIKIEKIMTIEKFLEICEHRSPIRDRGKSARITREESLVSDLTSDFWASILFTGKSERITREESDSPVNTKYSKWASELANNMLESVRKSQFEPVCNPWGFSSFGEFYDSYFNSTTQYIEYYEFIHSFYMWFYKGYVYAPRELKTKELLIIQFKKGNHDDFVETLSKEQISLLILEHYDNERKHFERLKNMYSLSPDENKGYKRPSIPEETRIEVWRRDEGKCARCGSNEKLEYDHIIPISKGGSNTARNIELLCEKCNRSKGANIE